MSRSLPSGPVGLLWAFWSGDVLPPLPVLPGLEVARARANELQSGFGLDPEAVAGLVRSGHTPYRARLGGNLVAYGWSASQGTFFGEPPVAFTVPYANRYLKDFVTLPASRGLGIYPRLLQKIIGAESGEAERFWIVHESSNQASARGIAKAGFSNVAEILVLPSGKLGLVGTGTRAAAGAKLLGLPLIPH